jgi:hypothetical protein
MRSVATRPAPTDADEREDASVEEHEVLDREVENMTDAGERQERDDHHGSGDDGAPDLRHVLGDYTTRVRASSLTATGTAASRSHGYLLVYFRTPKRVRCKSGARPPAIAPV